MATTNTAHTSLWKQPDPVPIKQSLKADTRTEICVVGAGLAGLSTAYMLAREGRQVLVLDSGPIANGQTQFTTAHLSNAIDDRYTEMERLHGEKGARFAAESHMAAINRIEAIARVENIDCDFQRVDGFLFLGPGQSRDLLEKEFQAANQAGVSNIEMLSRVPWPSYDAGPCIRFPDQGQFHPLKYLAGLVQAIERLGGRIFCHTHVKQVEGGQPARVVTKDGLIVTADAVVVATNVPINDRVAIHSKMAPYITYAIGAIVPAKSIPRGLYWDTLDPYHYVRLQPLPQNFSGIAGNASDFEVLIVGGEDHKTGQVDDQVERYGRLEAWSRERFPMIQSVPLQWSGQVMETIDGLAFIGRNPGDSSNVFVATGDSGMGMTHGTIAGILLTDLIQGRSNAWESLYDPSRKRLKAAGEFAKENLNVAGQYTDWLTGGDVKAVDQIPAGQGAILRRGLTKVAAYRDEQGELHECSAACPHLSCVVQWNKAEKTWDCPCHGSRFDRFGQVINGPAISDLSPITGKGKGASEAKEATEAMSNS